MEKNDALRILHSSVIPALGCTEPVSVALAAAAAAKAVGGDVQRIRAEVSRGIYKNGMSVGIAGSHKVGLDYAAALGALIGDTSAGLEIMRSITPGIADMAERLVEAGKVSIQLAKKGGIYVHCEVDSTKGCGAAVIEGAHTNIVLIEANGETLHRGTAVVSGTDLSGLIKDLKALKISEIRALAGSLPEDEIAFLMDGAEMDQKLAEYGIREKAGIGISRCLTQESAAALLGSGLMERVMARVAAATEARLDGCPLSTMSSAGSGSKGIAVILPVIETADAMHIDREKTLHALAFAHLMNEYINAHIGKLSAACTCAEAAATAVSASLVMLLDGNDEQIGYAIRNMTGSITGMICDGGKVGCALKLATAMSAAFLSATLALDGVGLRPTDGICAVSAEDCIRNMSRISRQGMGEETDREILGIMLDKSKQK